MKPESLNCPNCGAAVSSDALQCLYCRSRLKTAACPSCFGMMFLGSEHCPRCGVKVVKPKFEPDEKTYACPRCQTKMNLLQIETTVLRECEKCGGLWSEVEAFETICADRERQAVVLNTIAARRTAIGNGKLTSVAYVPCPECKQLMNRSNFARLSGVIIDSCKQHGVWFDPDELPRIIEFIHAGGLDRARAKDKMQIEEQKNDLRAKQFQLAIKRNRSHESNDEWNSTDRSFIGEIIGHLFD